MFDRDARGMTPFMLAVSGRAYPAAITVLEAAQKMAKGTSLTTPFMSLVEKEETLAVLLMDINADKLM